LAGEKKRMLVFEVKKVFHEVLKEQLYAGILAKVLDAKKESFRVLQERNKEGYLRKEICSLLKTILQLLNWKFQNEEQDRISSQQSQRLIYHQDDEKLVLKGEPSNGLLTATLQEVKSSLSQQGGCKDVLCTNPAAGAIS